MYFILKPTIEEGIPYIQKFESYQDVIIDKEMCIYKSEDDIYVSLINTGSKLYILLLTEKEDIELECIFKTVESFAMWFITDLSFSKIATKEMRTELYKYLLEWIASMKKQEFKPSCWICEYEWLGRCFYSRVDTDAQYGVSDDSLCKHYTNGNISRTRNKRLREEREAKNK